MSSSDMTSALAQLQVQLSDVDNLIERHPNRQEVAVPGDGFVRRPTGDQRPLLRSCMLLIYAAWEVYAEDSTIAAVQTLTERARLNQLPDELKAYMRGVAGDPWRLAGDGWRQATLDAVVARVRGDAATSHGINTAGPGQLAALHNDLFGKRFLDYCEWAGMTPAKNKQRLSELVSVRGSIAHTGTTPGNLNLSGVEDRRRWIWRLAVALDAQIDALVERFLSEAM